VTAQVGIRPERQIQRRLPRRRSGRTRLAPHGQVAAAPPAAELAARERGRGHAGVDDARRAGVGHAVQIGEDGHLARPAAHNVELGGGHLDGAARGHGPDEAAGTGHFALYNSEEGKTIREKILCFKYK
jgi:hypothetical protein